MYFDPAAPPWWRGRPYGYDSPHLLEDSYPINTGDVQELAWGEPDSTGLRSLVFSQARVVGQEIWLNDASFHARWSEFDDCHFRQRVRPICNEFGFSAQGSFGGPSIYRGCTFERVRMKTLGGFMVSGAWFENCTFINCRWEGHRSFEASYVDCTFMGKMNGTVWFGENRAASAGLRQLDGRINTIRGNDFSQVTMTDNNAWRHNFPVDDQRWPEGYVPDQESLYEPELSGFCPSPDSLWDDVENRWALETSTND